MGQISCCQPPPPKLDDFELLEEAKKRGLKIEMPETSPKQPPAAYLCREQSKEENANLRQIFDKFDKNKNGSIDVNEIMELCKALGAEISKFEAQEAMIQLDKMTMASAISRSLCSGGLQSLASVGTALSP